MEIRLNDYSDRDIINQFGPIEHYNTLLFDHIIAEKADCEGAMAVAGDAQLGSDQSEFAYDIGGGNMNMPDWEEKYIGLYENLKGYPTFVLGGKIAPGSTRAKVYEGPIVLKDSYQEAFPIGPRGPFKFEHGVINYVASDMVDAFFAKAYRQVACTSDKLFSVPGNAITSRQFRWFTELNLENFVVPNLYEDKKVVVLNYKPPKGDTATWFEMYLDDEFFKYDLVVINIDAKILDFAGGAFCYHNVPIQLDPRNKPDNKMIREISGRLVFNCPNTEIIKLTRVAAFASVIAPKANITALGGSINGMIIANSLHQQGGFEPHAFTIALGPRFWIPCEEPPTNQVKIIKHDSLIAEKTLAGAVFDLYKYHEGTKTFALLRSGVATAQNGILILENLAEGKYKLVETVPPRGYSLPLEPETLFEI